MKNIAITLAFTVLSFSVFAWGKSGHLIIGQLADQYLTPKTRAEIKKILGEESIGEAGTWLDAVAGQKEYRNQDNWHYVYVDKDFEDDAITKLKEFSAQLQDDATSKEDKLFALRVLIHIAGDIHCPIHCGYYKDHGGHKVKINLAEQDEKSNLHKVWDTDLIIMTNKEVNGYVTELQSGINADLKSKWDTKDYKTWVTESQGLLDKVYDFEDKTVDKAYYERHIKIVDERLAQAGVRLAFVLNSIFDV